MKLFKVSVRSDADPAGTRRQILEAAIRVFLANGYDKVSMDLIAEGAGVARRTLYNQFPEGKDAIFRAAVEHFWSRFPVMSLTTDDVKDGPRETLTRIGDAIVEFWKGRDVIAFVRLAIAETARFPNLMDSFAKHGKLPLMADMVTYLKAEVDRGSLVVPDTELAMRQFFGLVSEPLVWVRVMGLTRGSKPQYRREVVDAAVEMFLKMYAAKP